MTVKGHAVGQFCFLSHPNENNEIYNIRYVIEQFNIFKMSSSAGSSSPAPSTAAASTLSSEGKRLHKVPVNPRVAAAFNGPAIINYFENPDNKLVTLLRQKIDVNGEPMAIYFKRNSSVGTNDPFEDAEPGMVDEAKLANVRYYMIYT